MVYFNGSPMSAPVPKCMIRYFRIMNILKESNDTEEGVNLEECGNMFG